ncbi:MAG: ANTAR domain-containing protein, partial [Planctomycetota bacterium]|nr:ANTAR domain-containing protein [Planctomycetota bacterium]
IDKDGLRVTLSIAWSRWLALREQKERVVQLERNLQNRRSVEQAKWKLVEAGMTEPEAHRALQSTARNQRRPLAEIADGVTNGTIPVSELTDQSR